MNEADEPIRLMMARSLRMMRLIRPNEAAAANVSDEADASNSTWVNMAGFLRNDNFIVFSIISIVRVLLISLTKYCETFAEVKECFGITRCDNKLGVPVVQHG